MAWASPVSHSRGKGKSEPVDEDGGKGSQEERRTRIYVQERSHQQFQGKKKERVIRGVAG